MSYTEPHVPVPFDVIPKMLKLALLKEDELVFDLGSGDGRIVIAAARDFHALGVGVEIRKRLVRESRGAVKELGLSQRVQILNKSFKDVSLRRADVLATYLSSYTMNLLAPKCAAELRRGARIVNFDYPILDRTPEREVQVTPAGWRKPHPIYLYVA